MEKVAVIGLGNIAKRHRRNLKAIFPNTIVIAMPASDRVPTEHICNSDELVLNINELLAKDVQLVVIASPASYHAFHSIPLIEAGIPVLIEKPVTASLKDAIAIKNAANNYATPVAVGYCLRYLSSALEMKNAIDAGMIGQLYHVSVEVGQYLPDWRPSTYFRNSVSASRKLGGGALLELSHELDYTRWLLGDLAVQSAILRSSSELDLDVEDMVDVVATTTCNAVVYLHLDFLQRKPQRKCRFVGSEGALEWDLIANSLQYMSKGETRILHSEPDLDKNQMYVDMLEDFIESVNGQGNSTVSLSESIEVISLVETIKKIGSRGKIH